MKRIKEVIKQKAKEYHARRIYGERQVKHFLLVTFVLIQLGLFVEFGYYSTIGHLGQSIAFEIFKVHVIKLGLILGYVQMSSGMLVHEISILVVILNAMRLIRFKVR